MAMDFSKVSPQLFGVFKVEGGAHKRPQDPLFWMGWDTIENKQRWAGVQPSTYKILDPNKESYQLALKKMPNTIIVLRSWHLDDDEGKRWNELMADPVAAGETIIDKWLAETADYDIDWDRTTFMLWNEPHEWEGDAAKKNLVTATLAAMRRRNKVQPRMSLLVVDEGVGWPGNHDTPTVKDTPPDWSWLEPIHQEMLVLKIDILGMHEYWMKGGPDADLGWMAGRIAKCPWHDVPIIIGEAAYSGSVGKPAGSVRTELQGWAIYNISGLTAEAYMAQLIRYNEILRDIPNVIGWQVYLVDVANPEWKAKDIEPMYGLLKTNLHRFVPRKQTFVWGGKPPVVVPPPPIVVPKPTPPVVIPPEVKPVSTLTGKVVSRKPNDGTTSVYGQAPDGSIVYFAWRANDAIAGIQAGSHQGYENWKPGYFSIPLFRNGKTPTDGQWDVWIKAGDKTSPRVEFSTDGKGGKYNEIEVNFTMSAAPVTPPPPIVVPPVTPPVEPPPVVVTPGATSGLRWPLDKVTVTQWFGERPEAYAQFGLRGHNGIDFSCVVGTDVKAVADGTVAWVDDDPGGYGNYIRIWHKALNVHSFYAHLSACPLKIGDKVTRGEVIAKSGNTGNSTGPHLHFELRPCNEAGAYVPELPGYGKACDPVAWLAGFMAGLKRGGG